MASNRRLFRIGKLKTWLGIAVVLGVLFLFGSSFLVPFKYALPLLVVGIWFFGAFAMWQRANSRSEEGACAWWQDDSWSG